MYSYIVFYFLRTILGLFHVQKGYINILLFILVFYWHFQFNANCMLDDWEENLAVIAANRTKDDELVLIHLGDCMWKEKNDVSICTNDF